MGNILKVDPSEYRFVALKAPLVLFILERRLTKASGKANVSHYISTFPELSHGRYTKWRCHLVPIPKDL